MLLIMLNLNRTTEIKSLNSFPKDKILDWSKFKAFADDEINVTENPEKLMNSTVWCKQNS